MDFTCSYVQKVKLEDTLKLRPCRKLYAPGPWVVHMPERWLHVDLESKVESLRLSNLDSIIAIGPTGMIMMLSDGNRRWKNKYWQLPKPNQSTKLAATILQELQH